MAPTAPNPTSSTSFDCDAMLVFLLAAQLVAEESQYWMLSHKYESDCL